MSPIIRRFAHALDDEDYDQLFSLYPETGFEEDIQRYDARKAEGDPTAKSQDFVGVRRYSLNQSMLNPLLDIGGMWYIGTIRRSDTNYTFNEVFPEGEVTDEDKQVSEKFATPFINFAYTGDPNEPGLADEECWQLTFSGEDDYHVKVQVIGGP
ncbi:hypothetical protein BS50DRAFT_632221 [Corynespora cassiicola Philippines]|uniref:Carboxylesterase type B domain-containing protein n=1 Tax=Corynespora cassiicola Philippines TaxID=1448308 RepID=A0A2T2NY21_CORCC|nr:hypothetical protein BS50DRAFT_632221 [Corynespora cassiicola Philippines]